MGGKQGLKRYKNVFYSSFGLILVMLTGCQYSYYPKLSIEAMETREGREYLYNAKVYAEKKDFKTAFEENENAYEFFPPGMKQEAIFQKGLLYAHPENPGKNYEKAIACFELIGENAGNTVLEINSAFILSIVKNYSSLSKKDVSKTHNLRANKNKLEQYEQEIDRLAHELKQQENYSARLEKQIKQLKEVDLNMAKNPKGL